MKELNTLIVYTVVRECRTNLAKKRNDDVWRDESVERERVQEKIYLRNCISADFYNLIDF